MLEGSQTTHYQFMKEADLSNKADPFASKMRRLKGLSHALHQVIKHELDTSDGKVIEVIYKEMEEHTNQSRLYYEAAETSMNNLAKRYEEIVNSNRFQTITVYYDIIEKDKI